MIFSDDRREVFIKKTVYVSCFALFIVFIRNEEFLKIIINLKVKDKFK